MELKFESIEEVVEFVKNLQPPKEKKTIVKVHPGCYNKNPLCDNCYDEEDCWIGL